MTGATIEAGKKLERNCIFPVSLVAGFLLTSLIGSTPAHAAMFAFVDPGALDYRIASVTDLDIGGTKYDVTFHHGVTFDSLSDPITFETILSSRSALDEVVEFINSEAFSLPVNWDQKTVSIRVPYAVSAPSVFYSMESTSGSFPLSYQDQNGQTSDPTSDITSTQTAWATFSSAVPEPSTFVLATLGILSLGVIGRRRRNR